MPIKTFFAPGALALLAICSSLPALAQQAPRAVPRAAAASEPPVILRAEEIRGRPDLETTATGKVELERGKVVLKADELTYETADDLARARGNVRIESEGNLLTGRELQLKLQRFEGFFLDPTYFFALTGAGGAADRIDFVDRDRLRAINATYTSCPADGSGGPDWQLEAARVKLDFEANEGVAEDAVLRFLGMPILATPWLSFPLTDERKSGWLPPNVNLDSRSGFELGVPYYWNIAPQRDATLTPAILTRRGLALDSEFRYLEPRYAGDAHWHVLPDDKVAGRERQALRLRHDQAFGERTDLRVRLLRASDDAYWKDFPRVLDSLTPRLLANDALLRRDLTPRGIGDLALYARLQHWQVLRDPDPLAAIEAPYQRSPQLGLRLARPLGGGLELRAETELNRFTLPSGEPDPLRPTGVRLHGLGSVSRPWTAPWGWLVPKLSLNAATYRLDAPNADGRDSVSRTIPSVSFDAGLTFERDANWFGRATRQTLEPRVFYVNTPFRDQSQVPNFDSAGRDFNFETVFTDSAFSGIDRVSDSHQLSAGVTTRVLDPATGSERLRLGIVQRYLLRNQRITPDGAQSTRRFSDLLVLGSTNLVSRWHLDAAVQYSPDTRRTERSILGARYSPGPWRTISATYRLIRGASEQVDLAWQWPIAGTPRDPDASAAEAARRSLRDPNAGNGGGNNGECRGAWYSVGRINFNTTDSRITDSVLGIEYDGGCWIGRIVAERLSTGRSEATTRLLLQLELIGLSRLGSNPLAVLKDNIPGYRLLREERDDLPRSDLSPP